MKTLLSIAVVLFMTGCASTPPPGPRTVWINGYAVPENCLYADEQWNRLLPAIGSPNVGAHTVHTSTATYSAARVADQTYVCNKSAYDARKR